MSASVRNAWLVAMTLLAPGVSVAVEKKGKPEVHIQESPAPAGTIHVAEGREVVLPMKGVKRVAVGNTKVASARAVDGASTEDKSPAVIISDEPSQTLHLSLGHQMSLTAPGLRRVAVANPEVAEATVLDGKEVLLTGIGTGETSLMLWIGKDEHVSYRVKVAQRSPEDTARELKEVLTPQ